MKATTLFRNFCKENENLATLAKMVIKQMGGLDADTLKELHNTTNAAQDAVCGFIWYSDTREFWAKVRRFAVPYMEDEALGMGYNCALNMVQNFNMFRGQTNPTLSEIGRALYGRMSDLGDTLLNALAWYVLEEVAFRFHEWVYDLEEFDINEDLTD